MTTVKALFCATTLFFALAQAAYAIEIECGAGGTLLGVKSTQALKLAQPPEEPAALGAQCVDLKNCADRLRAETGLAGVVSQALLKYVTDAEAAVRGVRANSNEAALREAALKIQAVVDQCRGQGAVFNRGKNEKIPLSYTLSGPNKAKAGNYDKAALLEVAEFALQAGVDPFMAIGIVVMENPPTNMTAYNNYRNGYGTVPVDQVAAYDLLGCFRGKGKYAYVTEAQVAEYKPQSAAHQRATADLNKIHEKNSGVEHDYLLLLYDIAATDQQVHGLRAHLADLNKSLSDDLKGKEHLAQEYKKSIDAANAEYKKNLLRLSDLQKKQVELSKNPATKNVDKTWLAAISSETKLYEIYTQISQGKDEKTASLAWQELRCTANPKTCYKMLREQKKEPEYDFSFRTRENPQAIKEQKVCTVSTFVTVGGGPHFTSDPGSTEKGTCCAKVKSGEDPAMDLKSWLGAQYMNNFVQKCMLKNSMIYCLQKFNGLGCFGCTEAVPNSCLEGIVMEDRPVYGARVADLMVNTLMGNVQVMALVQEAASRLRQPVKSSFCLNKAPGKHTVADEQFLEEQKKYLLQGATGNYKASFNRTLRLPASAAEQASYLKREQKRAEKCRSLF